MKHVVLTILVLSSLSPLFAVVCADNISFDQMAVLAVCIPMESSDGCASHPSEWDFHIVNDFGDNRELLSDDVTTIFASFSIDGLGWKKAEKFNLKKGQSIELYDSKFSIKLRVINADWCRSTLRKEGGPYGLLAF